MQLKQIPFQDSVLMALSKHIEVGFPSTNTTIVNYDLLMKTLCERVNQLAVTETAIKAATAILKSEGYESSARFAAIYALVLLEFHSEEVALASLNALLSRNLLPDPLTTNAVGQIVKLDPTLVLFRDDLLRKCLSKLEDSKTKYEIVKHALEHFLSPNSSADDINFAVKVIQESAVMKLDDICQIYALLDEPTAEFVELLAETMALTAPPPYA